MQSSSFKVKVVGLLVSAGLFAGGVLAAPTAQNALQAPVEVDVQATLTAMENRLAGLESRVTVLESQGGGAAAPTVAPTEVPVLTHTLTGSLTITLASGPSPVYDESEPCSGSQAMQQSDDLSGFHKGTRITISDAAGTVVATGEFSEGKLSHEAVGNAVVTKCTFTFEVTGIADSDFYDIAIDGFADSIDFSKAELEERDWTLTLG